MAGVLLLTGRVQQVLARALLLSGTNDNETSWRKCLFTAEDFPELFLSSPFPEICCFVFIGNLADKYSRGGFSIAPVGHRSILRW